jgi:predicted DNA-binding protein
MEGKIQTIEDLAALIQETMASKEDIKEVKDEIKGLATKEDIQELRTEMNERLDHLDARVGRMEADIHELRGEIVYRHEFEDALARIKYLEKKLGIESGV